MSETHIVLLLLLACSILLMQKATAADPDPLVDFPPNASTPVFRDIFSLGVVGKGSGGVKAGLNVTIFPGLKLVHSSLFSVCFTVMSFTCIPWIVGCSF